MLTQDQPEDDGSSSCNNFDVNNYYYPLSGREVNKSSISANVCDRNEIGTLVNRRANTKNDFGT